MTDDDSGDNEGVKVKKIDLDKADVVKQEVCSRDEVMHVRSPYINNTLLYLIIGH